MNIDKPPPTIENLHKQLMGNLTYGIITAVLDGASVPVYQAYMHDVIRKKLNKN